MEGIGLNLKGLLFQAGNFLLLFAILSALFHRYFLTMIDARTKGIKDGLAEAEKARQQAQDSEKAQEAAMAEVQAKAGQLLAEAQEQAKAMEARITEQAQSNAEALMQQAQAQITQERADLKEQLRDDVVNLVITASQKVLGSELPESTKREQLQNLVKELS